VTGDWYLREEKMNRKSVNTFKTTQLVCAIFLSSLGGFVDIKI